MYSFSNNAPKKCKETPINGKDLKMTKGRSEFEKAQEQLCTYYLAKQQCGMLDLPTLPLEEYILIDKSNATSSNFCVKYFVFVF